MFEVSLMKYAFHFILITLMCNFNFSKQSKTSITLSLFYVLIMFMLQQRLKNKEIIRLDEERKKEAEKRRKEKEKQDEQLRQYFEKEKMEEEKKMVCLSDFLRYKYFFVAFNNSCILKKWLGFLDLYLQCFCPLSLSSYGALSTHTENSRLKNWTYCGGKLSC